MDEEIGPADLSAIFANLGREICRPLDALRAGLDGLLDDPGRPVSESDRAQATTLIALCEDLRRLTDDCMGGPDGAVA